MLFGKNKTWLSAIITCSFVAKSNILLLLDVLFFSVYSIYLNVTPGDCQWVRSLLNFPWIEVGLLSNMIISVISGWNILADCTEKNKPSKSS